MRLQLKSNSWYFAISNKIAKQRYSELKLFQTEEIIMIQVRGERVSSENRLEIERERERERERPERERTLKVWSESRKTRNGV